MLNEQRSYRSIGWRIFLLFVITALACFSSSHAFVISHSSSTSHITDATISSRCFVSSTPKLFSNYRYRLNRMSKLFLSADGNEDILKMRIGELKKELDLLGISTKAMLEKKELVEALTKARAEGRQPVKKSEESKKSRSSETSKDTDDRTRSEKIGSEMEKVKKMSVADMKQELLSRGISTKSFFEKSEFVRALAEARVDGVNAKGSSSQPDEPFDPSYKDVVVRKFDGRVSGPTIDVKLG